MKQYVPDYQATLIFGCDLKRLGQTKTGPESTLDPKIFVGQGVHKCEGLPNTYTCRMGGIVSWVGQTPPGEKYVWSFAYSIMVQVRRYAGALFFSIKRLASETITFRFQQHPSRLQTRILNELLQAACLRLSYSRLRKGREQAYGKLC